MGKREKLPISEKKKEKPHDPREKSVVRIFLLPMHGLQTATKKRKKQKKKGPGRQRDPFTDKKESNPFPESRPVQEEEKTGKMIGGWLFFSGKNPSPDWKKCAF